jgi:NET1-associated nuclear protein 1 (U3 small nucleolar RNA-associated protein 17)
VLAPCHRLITSTTSPNIVAAHTPADGKTAFSVFKATSANAIRSVAAKGKINRLVLIPSFGPSSKDLSFAGVSQSGEIFRFGDAISKDATVGSNAIRSPGDKGVSIWQEMFGKDAFLEIEESYDAEGSMPFDAIRGKRAGNPVDIFEGASHTLPPVSLLFDAFLDSILVPKSSQAGDVRDDRIIYEAQDALEPLQTGRSQKGREVKDEEIAELEVFFRDVLKTGEQAFSMLKTKLIPGDAAKTKKGKDKANGHLANGTEDHLGTPRSKTAETPSKSPKTPAKKIVEEEEDGDEVLASTESKGKKRGKKRKAPKEV